MTTPEPIECPACAAGLWMPNCTFGAPEPAPEPVAYLDPVRAAAAERALEQAEARIDHLTDELALTRDTLRLRSDAVNTVGATNDTLRATLAAVRQLADRWEKHAETIDPMSTTNAASIAALATMKGAYQGCAEKIHAALDELEPNA